MAPIPCSVTYIQVNLPCLRVWLQTNQVVFNEIQALLFQLSTSLNQAPLPHPSQLSPNQICFAKYGITWYRVTILPTTPIPGTVPVSLMDYGQVDNVAIVNVRLMSTMFPSKVKEYPAMAGEFMLADVYPLGGQWTEVSYKMIEERLMGEEFLGDVSSVINCIRYVRLYFKATGEPLSNWVVQNQLGRQIAVAPTAPAYSQWNSTSYMPPQIPQTQPQFMQHNMQFQHQPVAADVSISSITPHHIQSSFSQVSTAQQPSHSPNTEYMDTPHFKAENLNIGVDYPCYVSCSHNGPVKFNVQLQVWEDNLAKLMADINAEQPKVLPNEPKKGLPCLARYSEDSQLYRAVVTHVVPPEGYKIYYVDYGNSEVVNGDVLFCLPKKFGDPKVMSVICTFPGARDLPNVDDAFRELTDGKLLNLKVLSYIKNACEYTVELYDNDQNVFDRLMMKTAPPLERLVLSKGMSEDITVSYIYGPTKFYCLLDVNKEAIDSFHSQLESHCEANAHAICSSETLVVGSVVCAKYSEDEKWYRAEVLAPPSHSDVQVFFVDYGNSEKCSLSSIIPITRYLLTSLSAQAFLCTLEGLDESMVTEEMSTAFTELVEEEILLLSVSDVRDGVAVVNINTQVEENINAQLLQMAQRKKYPIAQPLFGNTTKMFVTQVENAPKFYAQLHDKSTQELNALEVLLRKTYSKNCPPKLYLDFLSHVGDDCVVSTGQGLPFYRAMVLSETGTTVEVILRDTGEKRNVHIDSVYILDADCAAKPAFGISCIMTNCNASVPNETFAKSMKDNWMEFQIGPMEAGYYRATLLSTGTGALALSTFGSYETSQTDNTGPRRTSWRQNSADSDRGIVSRDDWRSKTRIDSGSGGGYKPRDSFNSRSNDAGNGDWNDNKVARSNNDTWKSSSRNSRSENTSSWNDNPDDRDGWKSRDGEMRGFGNNKPHDEADSSKNSFNKPCKNNFGQTKGKFGDESTKHGGNEDESRSSSAVVASTTSTSYNNSTVTSMSTLKILKPLDNMEGGLKEVIVSFNVSPGEFYCQLCETGMQLDTMMELIAEASKPLNNPSSGTACIAKYSADDGLYRAQVESVSGTTAQVYFVDYGNRESCPAVDLKEMEDAFFDLPMQAISCRLSGVNPVSAAWSPDEIAAFCTLTEDKELVCRFVAKKGECYEVELLEQQAIKQLPSINSSLGKAIQKIAPAPSLLPVGKSENLEMPPIPHLGYPSLSVNLGAQEKVSLSWITDPDDLHLQLFVNSEPINLLMNSLQSLYSNLKDDEWVEPNPTLGLAVVARFPDDKCWYRAEVRRVVGPQVEVFFVDFGNVSTVGKRYVKRVKPDYVNIAKQCINCSIKGVTPIGPVWKPAEVERVRAEILIQDWYKCLFVGELDTNKYLVDLTDPQDNSVAKRMLDRKLAQPKEAASQQIIEPSNYPKVDTMDWLGLETVVMVTHVVGLNKFFCQFNETDADDMLNKMADFAEQTHSVGVSGVTDAACVAQFSEDEAWYRTRIAKIISDKQVRVVFVDFGNEEDTQLNKLAHAPADLLSIPEQAIECGLNSDIKSTQERVDAFQNLVLNNKVKAKVMGVISDGRVLMTLFLDDGSDIQLTLNSISDFTPVISTTEPAYASLTESPCKLWLQMASDSDTIDQLLADMTAYYTGEERESIDPHMGSLCAAFNPEDGMWYRAKMLTGPSEENTYLVLLCDYGNTVLVNSIKALSDDFVVDKIPLLAIECTIDVSPLEGEEWSEKAIEMVKEFTGDGVNEMAAVFSTSGDKTIVSLSVDGVDLADKLVDNELAKRNVVETQEQPTFESTGQPAYVSFVESPQKLWLQMSSDSDALEQLSINIVAYYTEQTRASIEPKEGLMCAAFSPEDKLWYRGQILEGPSEEQTYMYKVLLSDYGNTVWVDSIKALAAEFDLNKIPLLATECSLNVSPLEGDKWSGRAIETVKEFTGEGLIEMAAIFTIKGDKTTIELSLDGVDLAEKLVANGCARHNVDGTGTTDVAVFASLSESPYKLWLQKASDSDTIDQLLVDMTIYYREEERESIDSQIGLLCAAVNPEDEMWYRGKVLRGPSEENTYLVLLCDYGNTVWVDSIKALADDFVVDKIPLLAVECTLDVSPLEGEEWSEKAIEIVKEFTGEGDIEMAAVFTIRGDKTIVTLLVQGVDLTDKLVNGELARRIVVETQEHPSFENMSSAFASLTESPWKLWLQMASDSETIDQLLNDMTGYYIEEERESIDPQMGLLCAVVNPEDGMWYRGKVLEGPSEENQYLVLLCDYGDTVWVNSIKALADDFLVEKIPLLAIECTLDVSPKEGEEWSEAAIETVKEFTGEGVTEMTAVFTTRGDKTIVALAVNGVDLADKLVYDGRANKNILHTKEVVIDSTEEVPGFETTGVSAYASLIESPSKLWLQISSDSDRIDQLLADMTTYYTEEEREGIDPQMDLLCAAVNPEDGMWYRCKVLQGPSEENTYLVLLCDYGNTVWVDSIKGLADDFVVDKIPLLARQCTLDVSLLHGEEWSEKAIEIVKEFTGEGDIEMAAVFTTSGDKIIVALSVDDVNLADKLIADGLARRNLVETKEVPCHETVSASAFASLTESPDKLWLQMASDSETIDQLLADTTAYYTEEERESIDPQVGLLCAAVNPEDGMWYRSKVLEGPSKENTYQVLLCDYGNTVWVDSIKALADDFVVDKIPLLARECSLDVSPIDGEEWSEPAIEMVKEFTGEGGTEMTAAFTIRGEETIVTLLVQGVDLADKLVSSGLAKSNIMETTESPCTKILLDHETEIPDNRIDEALIEMTNEACSIIEEVPFSETTGALQVFASLTESPDKLWLQMASDSETLDKLSGNMNIYYTEEEKENIDPHMGLFCAAVNPEDGVWYRGKVQEGPSEENTYLVLLCDYGTTVWVNSIKALADDFVVDKIPLLARECTLDVSPMEGEEWSESAIEMVKEFTGEGDVEMAAVFATSRDKTIVALLVDGVNLADKLVSDGLAKRNILETTKDHPYSEPVEAGSAVVLLDLDMELPENHADDASSFMNAHEVPCSKIMEEVPCCEVSSASTFASLAESPDKLWLQVASDSETINQLLIDMTAYYTEKESERIEPQMGLLCAAVNSEDGMWYRGKVLQGPSEENTYQVLLCDFGNTVWVDSIKALADEFVVDKIPLLARECTLDVSPVEGEEWSERSIEMVKEFTGDGVCEMSTVFTTREDKTIVALSVEGVYPADKLVSDRLTRRNIKTTEDSPCSEAAHDVVLFGCETELPETEMCKILLTVPSCPVPLSSETVFVSHVDNCGSLWLQIASHSNYLSKQSDSLSAFYECSMKESPPNISVGMYCACKHNEDGLWYRAIVTDVKDDAAKVVFCDYGDGDIITLPAIRTLDPKFAFQPQMALHCSLKMLPCDGKEWCEKASTLILQMTGNGDMEVLATFEQQGDNVFVELNADGIDVASKLIEKGFGKACTTSAELQEVEILQEIQLQEQKAERNNTNVKDHEICNEQDGTLQNVTEYEQPICTEKSESNISEDDDDDDIQETKKHKSYTADNATEKSVVCGEEKELVQNSEELSEELFEEEAFSSDVSKKIAASHNTNNFRVNNGDALTDYEKSVSDSKLKESSTSEMKTQSKETFQPSDQSSECTYSQSIPTDSGNSSVQAKYSELLSRNNADTLKTTEITDTVTTSMVEETSASEEIEDCTANKVPITTDLDLDRTGTEISMLVFNDQSMMESTRLVSDETMESDGMLDTGRIDNTSTLNNDDSNVQKKESSEVNSSDEDEVKSSKAVV